MAERQFQAAIESGWPPTSTLRPPADHDKYQLLQAIGYAAMISKWSREEVIELAGARADGLADFLDVEEEDLNQAQRILLVAEAYDFEVLAAAEWLYKTYGVATPPMSDC